jgi:exopolyphosphatase/guanosine-5'-triphosphate,3'-diphosphate pyrophosphatase
MSPTRRAVIDVGTNSVKLLVAEEAGTSVQPLHESAEQTRLGRGFYTDHRLLPDAIEGTAAAVRRFADTARSFDCTLIRVIGTSAAREAVNATDLAQAILGATGLPLEIISGAQEAEWGFQGVSSDPVLAGTPLLLVDCGGGSTEFVLGAAGEPWFRRSYPIGAVRLLEQVSPSDPPTARDWENCSSRAESVLRSEVVPAMAEAWGRLGAAKPLMVGASGTVSVLARMRLELDGFDRRRIDGLWLEAAWLEAMRRRVWGVTLEERRRLPGLPPERADVILTGMAVYAAVVGVLGLEGLRVSTRSLRFAAVLRPA